MNGSRHRTILPTACHFLGLIVCIIADRQLWLIWDVNEGGYERGHVVG